MEIESNFTVELEIQMFFNLFNKKYINHPFLIKLKRVNFTENSAYKILDIIKFNEIKI